MQLDFFLLFKICLHLILLSLSKNSFNLVFETGYKDSECVLIKIDYVFLQSVLNEFSSKVHNCKYLLNLTKLHELIQLRLAWGFGNMSVGLQYSHLGLLFYLSQSYLLPSNHCCDLGKKYPLWKSSCQRWMCLT